MSRKALIPILIIALFVVGLVPTASAQKAQYKIGLSVPSEEDTYYGAISKGATENAGNFDVDLVVEASNNDAETEVANVQDMIDQGIDALLLTPSDPVASLQTIQIANEAGIPVFLLGSDVDTTNAEAEVNVTSRIVADDAAAGELAAKTLCEAVDSKGTVVELLPVAAEAETTADTEEPESAAVTELRARHDSFIAAMADQCADVTIVPLSTVDMSHDEVVDAFSAALKADKVNGVFAYNSDQILASMEAALISRQSNISFVSFEVTEDTVAAIQEGRLTAVITPSATEIGAVGLQTAVDYLDGKEILDAVPVDSVVLNLETLAAFRACSACRPRD